MSQVRLQGEREGGKGMCSHFLVLWIQGRFRSWSWELPAHSSRITPQHPPRAAGKAGMQRIPSHQGELSPGMGNICQAGKNPWLGSLQGLKRGGNPGWEALSRKSPGAGEVPALLCVPAGSGAGRESWEL